LEEQQQEAIQVVHLIQESAQLTSLETVKAAMLAQAD
jgi:hypothetical protein